MTSYDITFWEALGRIHLSWWEIVGAFCVVVLIQIAGLFLLEYICSFFD